MVGPEPDRISTGLVRIILHCYLCILHFAFPLPDVPSALPELHGPRGGLVGIDVEVFACLAGEGPVDLALAGEGVERGDDDGGRVDLEEAAKGFAAVAAAETVGAEGQEAARDPRGD